MVSPQLCERSRSTGPVSWALAVFTTLNILMIGGGGPSKALQAEESTAFERTDLEVTGLGPRGLVAEDINGDEIPDLIVANLGTEEVPGSQTLDVFHGRGDGSFKLAQTIPAGEENEPYGIAAADLRRTGILDIVVPNKDGNTVSVYLGRGDGTFGSPSTYPTGDSWSVSAADIDGDGFVDLGVGNFDVGTISILRGLGDGAFIPGATLPATASMKPRAVEFGDFDGDGRKDMVVPSDTADGRLAIFTNKSRPGRFAFDGPQVLRVGSGTGAAIIYDLDGDNRLDVVASSQVSNHVSVLIGNGNGTFRTPAHYWAGDTWPFQMALSDFNGDGKPDVIASGVKGARLSLLLGDGAGHFGTPRELWIEGPSRWLTVGDMDLDGRVDAAVGNYTLTGGLEHDPRLFFKTVSLLFNRSRQDRRPATSYRVNCGGGSYRDVHGIEFAADSGFEGGDVLATTAEISGTGDSELYRTWREGRFSYAAHLAAGRSYTVRLYLVETKMKKRGKRAFDVEVNGRNVWKDLDVLKQVPRNTAKVIDIYRVWPDREGTIKIDFVPVKRGAVCSAISIF